MKTKLMMIALIAAISVTTSCSTQGSYSTRMSDQGYVDIQLFYDQLDPYGQWIDYPEYGYVWIPDAGPGFAPYQTNGYWVMTEYGWTWVSDYPWGWAPFHYGRWDLDRRLGWFWVPDNQWGPAWVTWRRAEGYYGWAPMSPGMRAGYYSDYRDIDRWHFVRARDFGRPHINRYELNRRDYDRILRNSSVIDNTHIDRRRNATYIAGPRPDEVQRITGRRINSLAVRDNNRPGTVVARDQVRIYRPQVQQSTRNAAPARVYSRDQVNPGSRRNPQENIYLPNERRYEKREQIEQRQTDRGQMQQRQMEQQRPMQQPENMNRRQQRLEQRRMETEQRQQNNSRSARPFGQQKRNEARQEKSQPIEQQQAPQSNPQPDNTPNPSNNAPWGGGRRK